VYSFRDEAYAFGVFHERLTQNLAFSYAQAFCNSCEQASLLNTQVNFYPALPPHFSFLPLMPHREIASLAAEAVIFARLPSLNG